MGIGGGFFYVLVSKDRRNLYRNLHCQPICEYRIYCSERGVLVLVYSFLLLHFASFPYHSICFFAPNCLQMSLFMYDTLFTIFVRRCSILLPHGSKKRLPSPWMIFDLAPRFVSTFGYSRLHGYAKARN